MVFLGEWSKMVLKERISPPEYLKAKKLAKKSGVDVPEPEGLDWAYMYSNENLRSITKTTNIPLFVKSNTSNTLLMLQDWKIALCKSSCSLKQILKNTLVIFGSKWNEN